MVEISRKDTTENAIESIVFEPEEMRPYLGMSSIGDPCSRKLWYQFHWCKAPRHSIRTKRIFERGHWEEHRVIRDLKMVGMEVYRWDKNDNKIELMGYPEEEQQEIIGFAGHEKGHTDGEVLGVIEAPKTPHLLEIKTSNLKNFKKVCNSGVKIAKPVHYAQKQIYMHYRKLKRALYIMTCKDDESRHYERIRYNKDEAGDLVRKSQNIILSPSPPKREFKRTWYECKWCNFFGICHDGEPVEINCRTCKHHDLCDDGVWECSFYKTVLTTEAQRQGKECSNWINDPSFQE